jgi:stage II sporulation protein R
MERRMNKRSVALVVFALIMLLAIWEGNKTNAAVVDGLIPQDSIRLRILADSDSPRDQRIKRDVRDALVAQMKEWIKGPTTLEEARAIASDRMPELGAIVQAVLDTYDTDYGYKIELGQVPFPTKVYGGAVYPAGDYEALRVTLGDGEGQNWWCVLFPPLCFVDGVTGDAVSERAELKKTEPKTSFDSKSLSVKTSRSHQYAEELNGDEVEEPAAATDTEYRFFLLDWVQSWF